MRTGQSPSYLRSFVKQAGIPLGIALSFSVALFITVFLGTDGAYALEAVVLIFTGLLGAGLIRVLVRENLVTVILFLVAIVECVVLAQLFPAPWSGLWAVLVPANAIGVMVGSVSRQAVLISEPTPADVWLVNGSENPRTTSARADGLNTLASWDSADTGRFRVQRNDAVFEAVGNAATGFIVHCTSSSRDTSQWRVLEATMGEEETEFRLPSGPAYAPGRFVVDFETASAALRGFFHHRGPKPGLPWVTGEDVLEIRFG